MIKKMISFSLVATLLLLSSASAQNIEIPTDSGFVPRDTSKTIWEIGAGMGVPYGTFGGKLSFGNKIFTGDIGLGLLPFAWNPAISLSGAIHFRDRYADIRPKITFSYSNIVAAILVLGEGTFDPIYDESFSGVGIYAGFDWRLSKTSPICIDLNIGWIFPAVGNDEIKKKYNEVTNDFRSRGYLIEKKTLTLDTPKIFMGLTYSPGRTLK